MAKRVGNRDRKPYHKLKKEEEELEGIIRGLGISRLYNKIASKDWGTTCQSWTW